MSKKQTPVECLLYDLLKHGILRLTQQEHELYKVFKEKALQVDFGSSTQGSVYWKLIFNRLNP